MKKNKILIAILMLIGIMTMPVHAADYEVKELIPANIKTTVRGETFVYKNISYSSGIISIESIRNNSYEDKSLSVSLAVFGEDKLNIGIINYCEKDNIIKTKTNFKDLKIDVKSSYLESGKSYKDIKYYAVIGENTNCRTDGALEFIGYTVEQIGMPKNTEITDSTVLLLKMLAFIAIALVALFVYKFVFTTAYQNMDGEDVRQEYAYINKELRKDREREARRNPPQPKEVKINKTAEVLEQEKRENSQESKENTDLQNMFR